jgi:hypothetical protein
MNRPEVRIIDQQQEEITPANISNHEREMLLAKYGYKNNPQPYEIQPDPNAELSFEELCRREEQKIADERYRRHQQMYGPKPITFGSNNYYSNETYGSESDSGLSFKVTVVSDMPIPKNY